MENKKAGGVDFLLPAIIFFYIRREIMEGIRKILVPATWVFYLVIVCEILFMISPFALHFYSAYGPTLNFLDDSPYSDWLTRFFLPHFSETTSPFLNVLPKLGGFLIVAGILMFLAGAVPLYYAKLRRKGAVTGGLYKFIRHPQYVALAVLGLGTVLVWPRFSGTHNLHHHAFPLRFTCALGGGAVPY
jgi:protein-S-isoprenylcysteine O-methyltransferase Ste14